MATPSMSSPRAILIATLIVSSLTAGCRSATVDGTIPARRIAEGSGHFLVGAGRQDITPLPGFPMAGHSIAGKISRGYWTRLYARAFYLEDAGGTPLVLVSCDLWSVPAGLGDRVAEILSTSDLDHIGRENLILAATHTHQSEGNFATAAAFNDFAQPLPGFDPHLFDFLAQSIVTSIRQAYESRQPGRLRLESGRLPRFFRNRSMAPFLVNRGHQEVLEENADLPECEPRPGFPDPRACRAVDPSVTVLRAESADSSTLVGMMVFLAAHPTVMTHDTEVYSADLFGTASILSEQRLTPAGAIEKRPVVALFNGAEGDITTTWEQQDRRSLLRLARQLSDLIVQSGGVPADGEIRHQFDVMPIAATCFDDRGERRCTPANGVPGASAFGGAEDGRTVLDTLGFSEGRRGSRREAHGAKLPAFDLDFGGIRMQLTELMTSASSLPATAPIGLYRIGELVLATLPGEFTTTLGRRITADLRQAMRADRVLLIGLANEYLDYFTTPEEYDLQHYEGGMTMYGQGAGVLVGRHLLALAERLQEGNTEPSMRNFRYQAGRMRKFRIEDVGAPLYLPDDGQSAVLLDPRNGDPRRDFPCVCWEDGARRMKDVVRGKRSTASVRIEDAQAKAPLSVDGRLQDDTGVDFITIVAAADDSSSTWCSYWMTPTGIADDESVRFRILDLDGEEHRSAAFDAGKRFPDGCLRIR